MLDSFFRLSQGGSERVDGHHWYYNLQYKIKKEQDTGGRMMKRYDQH